MYACILGCSLPVQSAGGEMMVAEATIKGKKKELSHNVCWLLDIYGMLRQASQGKKITCLYSMYFMYN